MKLVRAGAFLLCVVSFLAAKSDILSLDLEDLSTIEVDETATLTQTALRNTPATVTVITHEDILQSGARDLDELLEIYVPSFTYMHKVFGSQMGLRGIISDRNNKILLLVNNRKMNIRALDGGALTERWFSTLGDIKRIKVITGPGSAIYGAGAIAGVISIETFNGKNIDGLYVSGAMGSNEDFTNIELSYGEKIDADLSYYIFYGADKDNGAMQQEAPMKFAFDYVGVNADEPYPYYTTNDNGAYKNELRHKLHFQLDGEHFTFWTRITKSSLATPAEQQMFQYLLTYSPFYYQDTGVKNQQITLFGQYRQNIGENIRLKYELSYLRSDVYSHSWGTADDLREKFWGEDNLMAKVQLNYDITNAQKLAIGSEYDYNWFGRPSDLNSADYSHYGAVLPDGTKWESDMLSFFGEYQLNFSKNFHMFAGGRADKHTYTEWMYSPRLAFVYDYGVSDVFKLCYGRSVRHSDDADLYKQHITNGSDGDVEKIDTVEFIYAKYLDDSSLHLSVFFNDHDIVAYNRASYLHETIGNVKSYGAEVEYEYKNRNWMFYISHSYTKMDSFRLFVDTAVQNISASVYGYGNDFANWNTHMTKMRLNYDLSKKLKWTNSLVVLWGMDGAVDMADYNKDVLGGVYYLPYYDEGHTGAFEQSIYLNTGLVWNMDEQTVLSIYGYNLAGILDEDYNKRNFFQTTSQYRNSAPSISVKLKYHFK